MSLSLRTKILLTIIGLLLASLLSSLLLSLDLFRADKRAYIFESQAALVSALRSQIEAEWKSKIQLFNYLSSEYFDQRIKSRDRQNLVQLIGSDDEIALLRAMPQRTGAGAGLQPGEDEVILDFIQRDRLALYLPEADDVKRVLAVFEQKRQAFRPSGSEMFLFPVEPGRPLIGILAFFASAGADHPGLMISAVLVPRKQFDAFSQAGSFFPALLLSDGQPLIAPENTGEGKGFRPSEEAYRRILATKASSGAGEISDPVAGEVIYAYARILGDRLLLVTQIPASSAYQASRKLIEKNVLATLFIIALAGIIGIIFAGRLTDSLSQLYKATIRFSRGDFSSDIVVKSRDEVGALAFAFRRMAGEIIRLLALSAEKARMERELETAQLVQRNFFPAGDIQLPSGDLAAFYKPASECGGDWWGYCLDGQKLYLCIGDATGHGVPAALITASVKSSFETLVLKASEGGSVRLAPDQILSCLNRIVYSSGARDVKMSFFVAEIDLYTGVILYSNAAHNFPLLCKAPGDAPVGRAKDRMQVLKKKPDPHLGDSLESEYQLHEDQMRPGDLLLMYTDGLIECQSRQGEMYGKKRLLKQFGDAAGSAAVAAKDGIVNDALAHFGEQPLGDDVTMVVFRMP